MRNRQVCMKIIVVDDHVVVRDVLCRMLAKEKDVELVTGAANGQAALQLLRDGLQADVVVTDLNMPGMNGIELTQQMLALEDGLRVVVLTLQSLAMVKQSALTAGAKLCLSKDGDFDELITAIRSVHAA